MTNYPILFGWMDLVVGNGFVAAVALNGRALLVDEGDGYWIYGVNPGGLAAGGRNQAEAQAEFRSAYRSVLFDIAAEAESFDQFKREVESVVADTCLPTAAAWDTAVLEVRSGKVSADWLAKSSGSANVTVDVRWVERFEPSVNVLNEPVELAA